MFKKSLFLIFYSVSNFFFIHTEEKIDVFSKYANELHLKNFEKPYEYNPLVPVETWQNAQPYFLPTDHPIRKKLDRIFFRQRATLSKETLEKNGFVLKKRLNPARLTVATHPDCNGYIFKIYLDSHPTSVNELDNFIRRIEGAKSIRKYIKNHRLFRFTAPRKWIYPLPFNPASLDQSKQKNFILIAEEIPIVNSSKNKKFFLEKITSEILDNLFMILREEGLIDSVHSSNIPFTLDGKIAFIDTEHHHLQPVPYHKLNRYLSPAMQEYWNTLIKSDCP